MKPRKLSKTVETRLQRVRVILPILKKTYPDSRCSLIHASPLQLLVATILSAQCTDERVNRVMPGLFKKYPTANSFAQASQEELERDIASTGFFRNKTKSLRGMAAALLNDHGGKVPETMEKLTALPGVGRKTANVVLGNAFGKDVGIVVDTHVGRLSQRLGLSKVADPVKIEQDLMAVVPQPDWTLWSHLLIDHGRAICQARSPRCEVCPISDYCPAGQKILKVRSSP